MVHGTSLDLAATVTPTVLDFGDVLPGTAAGRELRFDTSVTQSPLVAWTNRFSPPFTVDMNVLHLRAGNPAVMRVLATGAIPGDYSDDLVWTVQGEATDPPLPCALTLVVKLHARVVAAPDGGADGVK